MEELIKTFKQKDGTVAIDGRDLHDFLEVETPYTKWINRMIEYGFAENVDFSVFDKNVHDDTAFGGIRKIKDHALSLRMAKHLSMIQRTPRGEEARQYFISMEDVAKQYMAKIPKTMSEALRLAVDQMDRADQLEAQNKQLQAPALLGTAVAGTTESVPVGTFAKVLAQNSISMGQNRLFKWLRENGYLIDGDRRHNTPTQKAIELKVLEVRESVISTNHGNKPRFTPLVTGKGQQYFINKLLPKTLVVEK